MDDAEEKRKMEQLVNQALGLNRNKHWESKRPPEERHLAAMRLRVLDRSKTVVIEFGMKMDNLGLTLEQAAYLHNALGEAIAYLNKLG